MWHEILRDISIVIASCMAIYGIDSWRREYRGKRKMDLAEDALSLFYEARDAIRSIRSPFSPGGEGETRKAVGEETAKQKEARDQAFVVFERYQHHQEMFNKLHAMRYRYMANFGKEETVPFDEINKIMNEIFTATRLLAQMWATNYEYWNEQRTQKHLEQLEKYQGIIWWSGSGDATDKRIDEAVSRIEETTKAVIESKGTLYKMLNCELPFLKKGKK